MIGLDTNVLIRILVVDDAGQAELARQYLGQNCTASDPGFVNLVVVCELIWTLDRFYGLGRQEIANAVAFLLEQENIIVEERLHVASALQQLLKKGADPADLLIAEINRANGCEATATFDRKAAKLDGFTLIR